MVIRAFEHTDKLVAVGKKSGGSGAARVPDGFGGRAPQAILKKS